MTQKIFLHKDVFETEIVYLGGRVEYTGKIIYRGWGYVMEEAELFFADYHCTVWMKSFKHGSAAIAAYVYGDHIIQNGEYSRYPETDNLIDAYEHAVTKHYECMEIRFFRVLRRTLTLLMQVVCVITSLASATRFVSEPSVCNILFVIAPILIFFLFGSFYKYYRYTDPANYKCIVPDLKEKD